MRIELETALRNEICAIPVLVHGAELPGRAELPRSLRKLRDLNALKIDSGADFHSHVDRLIRHVDQQVNAAAYDAAQRFTARSHVAGPVEIQVITRNGRKSRSCMRNWRNSVEDWLSTHLLLQSLRNERKD